MPCVWLHYAFRLNSSVIRAYQMIAWSSANRSSCISYCIDPHARFKFFLAFFGFVTASSAIGGYLISHALSLAHANRKSQSHGTASAALVFGKNSSPTTVQVLPAVSALGRVARMCCHLTSRGSPRITIRSSRNRFVPPNTWQVELAMCLPPLRVSA